MRVYLIVDTIQHNSAFNLVLKSWTDLVNNDLEVLKQHSKAQTLIKVEEGRRKHFLDQN